MQRLPMPRAVLLTTLVWAGLAIAAGASGVIAPLKPPAPQLVILALTIAAIYAATRVAPVRALVDSMSLQGLIGFHVVRFVGVVFLVLGDRGSLSPIFASRAGWGDIVAAAGALLIAAFGAPTTRGWRRVILGWNTFGVLDLVVAVTTAAAVVFRGDVPGMAPLFGVPLILVPMFLVPLLFASHVVIYRRFFSARPSHGE